MKALALAALLLATPAAAYTDADYCRDTTKADRSVCHAEHLLALADCALDYAWERWAGIESAEAWVADCRSDADAACRECRAAVACEVQP